VPGPSRTRKKTGDLTKRGKERDRTDKKWVEVKQGTITRGHLQRRRARSRSDVRKKKAIEKKLHSDDQTGTGSGDRGSGRGVSSLVQRPRTSADHCAERSQGTKLCVSRVKDRERTAPARSEQSSEKRGTRVKKDVRARQAFKAKREIGGWAPGQLAEQRGEEVGAIDRKRSPEGKTRGGRRGTSRFNSRGRMLSRR